MWIADMDFPTPDFVMEAFRQRLEHPVMGYFYHTEEFYQAIVSWMQKRHQWSISPKWICFCPGIVTGLSFLIQTFSQKGDKILIQTPVYHPFYEVIEKNGREILQNPLQIKGNRYEMDYNDLEEKLKQGPQLMIISNPHNPVARCWQPDELKQLAELCLKYRCLLISDEIHSDLVMRGFKHTPVAKLSNEIAQNTITCMAPSKTFNLAGLATSEIIIPNPQLRAQFKSYMNEVTHIFGNIFGDIALQAAYTQGAEWLDQLRDYLTDNVEFCQNFIAENIPGVKTFKHEATYLLWVDFKGLGLTHKQLWDKLLNKAHLGFNDGRIFGEAGDNCMRINLACPRSIVVEAMNRLKLLY
ncbi:MAG: pyridoxal phosphate-dependent aminotransferase [Bacteroidales bacterium]|nr:pyridoxal phosphate-dependent aminotransferase [Bacteroidales bacterium]